MPYKTIVVNDKFQEGYEYELTQPEGENFGEIFKPQLTPKQMLELGVFGGKYLTDCTKEFPKSWFKNAKFATTKKDIKLNYFQIDASQSLKIWNQNGWIHPDDPRGWFQWYCRYYMGRRNEDDNRQTKRWKNMIRHVNAIKNNCDPGDLNCRKRQRQAVLHWAYDSRNF